MTEQRERLYVVEYVRTAYPNDRALFNVRLGAIPTDMSGVNIGNLSPNIFKVFNRYVDALVIKQDRLIMIEAKILLDLGAISQLQYYATIYKGTPELANYFDLPLELELVTATAEPSVVEFANQKGIRVVVFQTPQALNYVKSLLR